MKMHLTHPMVAAPRDGQEVARLGKNGVWRDIDPKRAKPAHAFVCLLAPNGSPLQDGVMASGKSRPKAAFAIVAACSCKRCDVTMIALNFACQRDGAASVLVRAAVKLKR